MSRSICRTLPCAVIGGGLLIAGIALASAQPFSRPLGVAALLAAASAWFVVEFRRN